MNKPPDTPPARGDKSFPPRRRSIPTGFDFDLDEVWWSRLRNQGSSPESSQGTRNKKDPSEHKVSPLYYSRHCLPLGTGSSNSQPGRKGVLGPSNASRAWIGPAMNIGGRTTFQGPLPSRAHDGTKRPPTSPPPTKPNTTREFLHDYQTFHY